MKFLISTLFLLLFLFTFDYFLVNKFLPSIGGDSPRRKKDLYNFYKVSQMQFVFVLFSAFGTYQNWKSLYETKKIAIKQKEILNKELDFLKNEFHTHITFNFLNFCYLNIYEKEAVWSDAILSFSDILSYSLKNSTKNNILLNEEIEYLNNLFSLYKIIYPDLEITFYNKDFNRNILIKPMILSTLLNITLNNQKKLENISQINSELIQDNFGLIFILEYHLININIDTNIILDDFRIFLNSNLIKHELTVQNNLNLKSIKLLLYESNL